MKRSFLIRWLLLLSLTAITLGATSAASASTINVPGDQPTIQAAVTASSNGDTVLIADGTYTGPGNVDIDFGGKSITVTSQHGAASTIIDCGGSSGGSNDHRGFLLQNSETATISGLTIENGYISTAGAGNNNGGAIDNVDATLTIANCVFANNTSTDGGAIIDGGNETITNCTFTGNTDTQYGGGAIEDDGTGTITNCTFTNNTDTQASGGAIIIFGTDTVTNCTFTGNTAASVGGSIYNNSSSTIVDCTFTGNMAPSGGGMENDNTATVTGCTFIGNTATTSGGGIYNDGNTTVTGCTLTGNTAPQNGGGIYNDTNIIITNCALAANTASVSGGGIYSSNTAAITNCTLTGNTAPSGGGVYSVNSDALINTIVYGDSGSELVDSTSTANATYCDIQGGFTGTGNINADPKFVSITDFHLQLTSPCLGAGTATGAPSTDIAGVTRPNPPSIGAYEIAPTLQSLAITPTPVNLTVGAPQTLTLTATYSNSSTANVTAQATWSSLNSTVVTVDNTGLATPHAAGLSVFTAAFGGLTATTNATITNPNAATDCDALWTRTDSEFSLWQFPNASGFANHDFDAIPGYTAQSLAVTPDGHAHVLLTASDGTAILDDALVSTLTTDHNAGTTTTYGPYSGWTAQALTAGTDGNLHLLWAGTGGSMALWTLTGSTVALREYGPYAGWTPQFLATAPDNTARVLWTNTNGQVAFWVVNPGGTFQHFEFGPYSGWAPVALATGPDGLSHITWNHAGDGQTALWTITDAGQFVSAPLGTYSGWGLSGLAVSGDDTLHLGWAGTNGTAALWAMPNANPLSFTHSEYGPFVDTGWSLKALSATP